jgi:hypothetical protein
MYLYVEGICVASSPSPEVVDLYRGELTEALRTNADIIVHTGDGGPMYVREVQGRVHKQGARTLGIGPVSVPEMEQLRDFVRSSSGPMSRTLLGPDYIEDMLAKLRRPSS